jgi:DNA-binding transcriptional regulator PaaX
MSVRHLAAVAELSDISSTCKLLLYGLAINADPTGWSTCSMRSLMRSTCLSERSIRDNLKHLRDAGFIEKQSGFRIKLKLS